MPWSASEQDSGVDSNNHGCVRGVVMKKYEVTNLPSPEISSQYTRRRGRRRWICSDRHSIWKRMFILVTLRSGTEHRIKTTRYNEMK